MMKKRTIALFGATLFVAGLVQADLALTDEICITAENVVTPFGDSSNSSTLGPDNGADFRYTARDRDSVSAFRMVATFLKYDTSSLTVADVNDAGFSATLTVGYVGRLNSVNHGMDFMVGTVVGGDWDDEGSTNPDYAWSDASADQVTLLSDVANYGTATNITVDVTALVQGWVNGTTDNYGITLFGADNGGNASNGAYMDSVTISTIPEPATIGLIGAMGGALLFIRRRFMI